MNFSNILSEIEKIDPEVYERTSQRRSVIKNMIGKVTLATLPLALGALFQKAYGRGTLSKEIIATLNFALQLEYLERDFYNQALVASRPPNTNPPLIPSGLEYQSINKIYQNEVKHVEYLVAMITNAGGIPISAPFADYTYGLGAGTGPFTGVFTNFDIFLSVAQTLEDLGVRAYKGQAANIMSENDLLTAVLRIHSTEARHAAHIRKLRAITPSAYVPANSKPKPWITGTNNFILMLPELQAAYTGEDNTLQNGTVGNPQSGIQITGINGLSISGDSATEAFDESLSKDEVVEFIKGFYFP
jgi:hypothetical protein